MNLLRRRHTDAIIDGLSAGSDARLEPVRNFVEAMRNQAATFPAPAPRPRLAATLDGRRPLRAASDPVVVLAPPNRARRRALRPAVVALATGAVFFGGLATAGALPGPLQHASSDLTSHVGIHLPGATPAPIRHGNAKPGTSRAPTPPTPGAQPIATSAASTSTTPPRVTTPSSLPAGNATPTRPTTPTAPVSVPVSVTVPPSLPTLPIITLPSVPLPRLPRVRHP